MTLFYHDPVFTGRRVTTLAPGAKAGDEHKGLGVSLFDLTDRPLSVFADHWFFVV